MRIYPTFFNIFFKGMDPEKAHHVGFWGVQTLRNVGITRALRKYFQPAPELATTVMGITFPSPFGLAAGFDKGGKGIAALAGIGFGHVEMAPSPARRSPATRSRASSASWKIRRSSTAWASTTTVPQRQARALPPPAQTSKPNTAAPYARSSA